MSLRSIQATLALKRTLSDYPTPESLRTIRLARAMRPPSLLSSKIFRPLQPKVF
jgi:hypothetical protein